MTIESPKYIEHLTNARGNSQRGCEKAWFGSLGLKYH